MQARIEDVARLAGVSAATVSRALRGLPSVSPATRERVERAAEELSYVLSPTASNLKSGRTNTIGLIVSSAVGWFFGAVVTSAGRVLRQAGFDVLLYTVGETETKKRFFAEMPLRRRVDAVLAVYLPVEPDELDALAGLGVPTVFLGSPLPGVTTVGIDDHEGSAMATRYLLNLGHRRIATISGDPNDPMRHQTPFLRRDGYRQALAEAGIGHEPGLDAHGDFTVASGVTAMSRLLAAPTPPTAVVVQSDEMAFGAMHAIAKAGLRVPEDISVIGFDNHEMSEILGLSTVAQPVAQQGTQAAELLLAALDSTSPAAERRLTLPVELRIRHSTAPPGRSPDLFLTPSHDAQPMPSGADQ